MMTRTFTRFQAAVVGCSLALASCLAAHGWRPDSRQQAAFALPNTLGTWELVEQATLQERQVQILQAGDHWRRVYRCKEHRDVMVVTMLSGAAGPLVAHLPEVCYDQNEFCAHSELQWWTVPQRHDRFCFQTLDPRQLERPAMTVAYAWHDRKRWRAPRYPRFRLAGHGSLQRLQVTMRHPRGMNRRARSAMQQFIKLATASVGSVPSSSAPATALAGTSPEPKHTASNGSDHDD